MSKTLIFAEQRSGHLHPAAQQLITAARETDGAAEINVCLLGKGLNGLGSSMSTCGAAGVYCVDHDGLERYHPQLYTSALNAVVQKLKPRLVLLAATFMGRDLAPRLAARTGAALATDCVELRRAGDAVMVKRPMYMGKVSAELRLEASRMNIVSIRPNTFAAAVPSNGQPAKVEQLALEPQAGEERLVNRELAGTGGGIKDVTEADIVVSGGRSLKNEDNFKILYQLAEVLDGAVGASRAACDAGYQPHSRQVGLTGKTVTPKLYMAFGIDGAIQHLAGMRGSKVIAAINTKAEAPIFSVATYGCVADLFVMAPLLTEEFKKVLHK